MQPVRNNWRLTGRRKNLWKGREQMNNATIIAIATMFAASVTFGCTGTKKTEAPDVAEAAPTVTDVGTADDAATTATDAAPEAAPEAAEAPATEAAEAETTTEAGN
jgi:hypothetical protein